MKMGQLWRKLDEGSAEGRWTMMDILRESQKVLHVDSIRRLASLGRSESVGRERLRESDCVRVAIT